MAASVRDVSLVRSGRSLADRGLCRGIQSRKWRGWRRQQFDVCGSRRAGQHFRPRRGRTTIWFEWFGAVRRPTEPAKCIQAFSEQRTHFTAGPPYSPQQLKSVLSAAATRGFRRTQASGPFGTRSRRHAGCNDQDYCRYFYILCPDNDVPHWLDERRILWTAGDIVENRPPLSRWHPDYADAFAAFVKKES